MISAFGASETTSIEVCSDAPVCLSGTPANQHRLSDLDRDMGHRDPAVISVGLNMFKSQPLTLPSEKSGVL
jgi:hypothetical protein